MTNERKLPEVVLNEQSEQLKKIKQYLELLEKWIPYLKNVADAQLLKDLTRKVLDCGTLAGNLSNEATVLASRLEMDTHPTPIIYGPPDEFGHMEMIDPDPYDRLMGVPQPYDLFEDEDW
jgi:hypothetical protein